MKNIAIMISVFISCQHSFAQDSSQIKVDSTFVNIRFTFLSNELSDDNLLYLNLLGKNLSDSNFKHFEDYYLVLELCDCINEVKVNPCIGITRLNNVMSYLVNNFNFSYYDFLITYPSFPVFDYPKCNFGEITFQLKKK